MRTEPRKHAKGNCNELFLPVRQHANIHANEVTIVSGILLSVKCARVGAVVVKGERGKWEGYGLLTETFANGF